MVASTFKKCDLHVHSSSCYSRNYEKSAFLDRLSEVDLDVVAITDHNSVDVKLLEAVHDRITPQGKHLFAGVELNVKLKDKTIDDYKLKVAEGHDGEYFHGIVWCKYEDRDRLSDAVDSLFAEQGCFELESLSGLERKSISKITEGHAVYLEDVQNQLASLPYFFVFHENKGDRNLSDYLPNHDEDGAFLRENDSFKDRLFYYSHAMAVEGGEKSRKHVSVGMEKALNSTVAALLFSDADERTIRIGERFTWIDFDADFDSLLLAVSDPESRIRTSDVCPTMPQANANSYLERIEFEIKDGAGNAAPVALDFSPGMNGIVGSRGSGKSMLARILCQRDLKDYEQYIEKTSIRYKQANAQPTANCPDVLYLKQGELESIFNNERYSEVPFLKDELAPIEHQASSSSEAAFAEMKQLLELQCALVNAFMEKYPGGAMSIDVLDAGQPSGLLVEFPKVGFKSDQALVSEAGEAFSSVKEELSGALAKVKGVDLTSDYPEGKELFDALSTERKTLLDSLEEAIGICARLQLLTNGTRGEWFAGRENLHKAYAKTKESHNDKQGSSELANYKSSIEEAKQFLSDLLELRIALLSTRKLLENLHRQMMQPIQPLKYQIGTEEIEVQLFYEGCSTLRESMESLLSAEQRSLLAPMATCCLVPSETEEIRAVFNGQKVKRIDGGKAPDYVVKYTQLLVTEIAKGKTLKERVLLDGKALDDMSPGMRAEALLKLFLEDRIAGGQYLFVVLDQPEDNLDTDTISKFLIDRLKKLKLNVQLFVVSHSAPIIVNGDARNIIVCSEENGTISYKTGTINSPNTKQDISNVLDGGERYIKMRLNKYNFQVVDER